MYTLNGILEDCRKWELTGYIGVPDREVFRNTIAALRSLGGVMWFQEATGEGDNTRYAGAKELAQQGAAKDVYNEPDPEIHPSFNLTGAQLATMTQSLTYKGVCELKNMKS